MKDEGVYLYLKRKRTPSGDGISLRSVLASCTCALSMLLLRKRYKLTNIKVIIEKTRFISLLINNSKTASYKSEVGFYLRMLTSDFVRKFKFAKVMFILHCEKGAIMKKSV